MSIPQEITDTIRFFSLLFKGSEQEVREMVSEEVQDMEFSGKNIYTPEEVREVLERIEGKLKVVFQQENERVSKLVGSLCMQLMGQANQQGAKITPHPAELEDDRIIQLFTKGTKEGGSGVARIGDTSLLNNEHRITELQEQLQQREAEVAKLNQLLGARVDQAPQFQNLKKMLAAKEQRIDQLEAELEAKK